MTVVKDPWFRNRLIRDQLYRATHEAMVLNPNIYLMGEGSGMKVHFDAPQIERDFPGRVITLPISEDGNSNFAVGLSLAGVVPIVDVISSDFLFRTMDAICNTMAKAAAVGRPRTMIVRAEFMTGGPTSGQRIESLFTHIPGLHVAIPSNPQSAYRCMHAALARKGVTLLFEDRTISDADVLEKHKVHLDWNDGPPSTARHQVSKNEGPGRRLTVVSYGAATPIVEQALGSEPGFTLIDLETLYPLDTHTILDEVLNSHARMLIVEPAQSFMGIGAELAAFTFENLLGDWPWVKRLGAPRMTIPASRDLHSILLPTVETVKRVAFQMAEGNQS